MEKNFKLMHCNNQFAKGNHTCTCMFLNSSINSSREVDAQVKLKFKDFCSSAVNCDGQNVHTHNNGIMLLLKHLQ